MSRLMVPAAAVAAAAAIVTAGCASAGASGPGSGDGAAAIVPSNAVAFIAASTDLGSSQLARHRQAFLTQFKSVAPALGDELDVAVLPGKQIVGLTQPKDSAKLAALAKKHRLQTRVIGGWTAIAKTSAALDAVANATSHLADNNLFVAAMNRLPERRARPRVRERAGSAAAAHGDSGRGGDDRRAERRALPLEARRSGERLPPQRRHDRLQLGRRRADEHERRAEARGVREVRRADRSAGRRGTSSIRRRRTRLRSPTRSRRARSRSSTSRSRAACSRTC